MRPACSSYNRFATRRTASRSGSAGSAGGARSFETIFDTLQGVGPARRRAILHHFGSPERFLEASQEELEGVPELPAATARKIYAQLHKAGRA
jgi:ERCC4-type nuclease